MDTYRFLLILSFFPGLFQSLPIVLDELFGFIQHLCDVISMSVVVVVVVVVIRGGPEAVKAMISPPSHTLFTFPYCSLLLLHPLLLLPRPTFSPKILYQEITLVLLLLLPPPLLT